ncbi:Protein N-acetyltransferase, RimJ/RimL family [Seinonella peptonophila]|uniref:Protein N-acetyltransferase, RimJ/RimL family n=1 Tax=Seinonella peptonophila TaxID=112248 RepID=A0A1M4ZWV0_9BACL|nr:GNAT family protein [Seinonella peptonophila]SHF22488.1 Protein N-acetyltransferase, RimJ/RimL family [Seinonella peptonophila]
MELTFRKFEESDLDFLKNWFEDVELKKRLGGMLSLDEWYFRVIKIPNQKHIMFLNDGRPVGKVCIEEYENKTASISLFVNPQLRNQGFGSNILTYILSHPIVGHLESITAYIEPDNPASYFCFKKVGFVDQGVINEDGMRLLSYKLK